MTMIEMRVSRLMMDPFTNLPVLLLTDEQGGHSLPVGIGVGEAPSIATELSKVSLQRPMTHDLIKTILAECGASVEAVELRDMRGETMYATIVLVLGGGGRVDVDARPSDAIALALRTGAAIRVARKLIDKTRRRGAKKGRPLAVQPDSFDFADGSDLLEDPSELGVAPLDAASEAWILEALRDEDFGKWKM